MKTIIKHVIFIAIFLAAAILLILICGDEAPDANYTLAEFWGLKMQSILSAFGLYHLAKFITKRGWLPKWSIDDIEKLKKEEDKVLVVHYMKDIR